MSQKSDRPAELLPLGHDGAASLDGAEREPQFGNLTRVASRGVLWASVNTVSRSIIRFVTTAILARQLTPEDFGVFGMALLVNEIVNLFGGLSLGVALIQRKAVDTRHFDTMFWANLAIGTVLTVACFLAAPVAAVFFHTEHVKPVVMAMSVSFLLASAGGVHRAILTRELAFHRFAVLNVTTSVVRSVVSLGLVFMGAGLWALVAGMLAERLTTLVVLLAMVPWRPRLAFHRAQFLDLFRFSRSHYADNVVRYFNGNSDFLMTGRLLGPTALGFYQMAYNLPHLVLSHFSEVISEVLFPVYCRVQDDHARFRLGYTKTLTFISLVSFPLMAGLALLAPEFIPAVYGEKWLPAVVPLQILCFSGATGSIIDPIGALLNAKGRPDIGLRWNAGVLPLTLAALLVASRWGTVGIAAAMSLLTLWAVFPLRVGMRLIGLRPSEFFRALAPALGGSAVMVAALAWLKPAALHALAAWPSLGSLLALVGAGAAIYVAAVWLLWPQVVRAFLDFGRKMLRGKSA